MWVIKELLSANSENLVVATHTFETHEEATGWIQKFSTFLIKNKIAFTIEEQ